MRKRNFHLFYLLRNETEQIKFEDLIVFIKQFMNWAVCHLVSREMLPRTVYNTEGFYRKGMGVGGGRGAKEKVFHERLSSSREK